MCKGNSQGPYGHANSHTDSYRDSCPSRNVAASFEQSLYEGHGRIWVESDLERNHPFSQWSDDMLFFLLPISKDPQLRILQNGSKV